MDPIDDITEAVWANCGHRVIKAGGGPWVHDENFSMVRYGSRGDCGGRDARDRAPLGCASTAASPEPSFLAVAVVIAGH
jgi:hypothetical protein